MRPRVPLALLAGLALTLAACALTPPPPPAATAEPETLTLASTDWAPFTAEEGQPRVASELVSQALAADRIEAQLRIVPVDGWLEGIRSGEFDGSAAMWWSEDRAEYMLFSEPYLQNRLVLIAHADADLSARSLADLGGQRVGIVEGYAYGEALDEAPRTNFVAMEDTPANLRALLADELDYVLADALYAQNALATHPQREQLAAGQNALVTRSLHFALRKDLPEAAALVESFDKRVRQMLRDGSYNEVLGFGWIEADVNGDGVSDYIFAGEHAGEQPPSASYRVRDPEARKPEVELQPEYIINGQPYTGWDSVPDSFKTPGVGGTNIGIGINW